MAMPAPDYRLLTQLWSNLSNVLDVTSFVIYSETSIKRTPIKRTPSIKRTLRRVPKLTSYIFPFITNPYSAETSIKQTQTLK